MDGSTTNWIERAVVEADRRRSAAKVVSITEEDAVERGDNFISDLKRLTLDVVTNSGERQTRKLIFKVWPETERRKEVIKRNGIFIRERRVYLEIIPEMEDILKNYTPSAEFLWPYLHGIYRYKGGFLMEDLMEKGFKMQNRRNLLDFEHSVCVMRNLAKYHALGAVVRKNGNLRVKDFYPPVFVSPSEMVPGLVKKIINSCADKMENVWKGEWVDYGRRLRKLVDKVEGLIDEEYKLDDSNFMTLNHGDCWTNNILFRYDKNGKPESLRFVDFQMAHFNTPAFDLHMFFTASLDFAIWDKKPELIAEYHKSLSDHLTLFDFTRLEIPTLEAIMKQMNATRYYQFCLGFASVPFLLVNKEKAMTKEQLEVMSKEFCEKEGKTLGKIDLEDELVIKLIKHVVKEGEKNKIL